MNVKPVSTLSPFNVNTATEAREDRKNREDRDKKRRGPKTDFTASLTEGETTTPESQVADPSQIVDTATYLELLSHQPKPEIRQIRGFLKKRLHTPKIDDKSATSDPKKLNKSL